MYHGEFAPKGGFVLTDDTRKRLENINKDAWLLSNEILTARVEAIREGDTPLADDLADLDRAFGFIQRRIHRVMAQDAE